MKRIITAFRLFFKALRDPSFSKDGPDQIESAKALSPPKEEAAPRGRTSARSEAITLLAWLQREGRLLDFFMENLDGYEDAQVGAAVRDVHRSCKALLQKLLGPAPLLDQPEGGSVTVPEGFDPEKYRFSGNLAGRPPYQGTLRHAGWKAARCELPAWTGDPASALVIAPAEVELP